MIVQLRSPLAKVRRVYTSHTCTSISYYFFLKGKSNQFITRLLEWLETQRPSQVILLASLYAEERMDRHIQRY